MKIQSKLWTFLLACTAVTASAATDNKARIGYTGEDLEAAWSNTMGNNGPMFALLFSNVLQTSVFQYGQAPAKGRFGAAKGNGDKIVFFPIVNFNENDSELLFLGAPRLAQLESTFANYVGIKFDGFSSETPSSDEINARQMLIVSRQNAIKLEGFSLSLGQFLSAERLMQKCQFYKQAEALARELDFNESKSVLTVPPSYADYYKDLKAFYNDSAKGFGAIPEDICELHTLNSVAATEAQMKAKVEEKLKTTMEATLKEFNSTLSGFQGQLAGKMTDSEIKIPVRGLFALERGFRDSKDLFDAIATDSAQLYTNTPKSLITQLQEDFTGIENQPKNLDAVEKSIKEFQDKVRTQVLPALNKIAGLQGLSPQHDLSACGRVTDIPSEAASNDAKKKFQEDFELCLKNAALIYKELKSSNVDDPLTLRFSGHLAQLVRLYTEAK